jgi:signal transduction histidine kinase
MNLINNSLKFTKIGFIVVKLKDLNENSISIEVIDNGSGI